MRLTFFIVLLLSLTVSFAQEITPTGTVSGFGSFNQTGTEQMVIDISLNRDDVETLGNGVAMQKLQGGYPVLIKGSEQGLAIEVKGQWVNDNQETKRSHRGNNYVSFWRTDYDGQTYQTGRIEGLGMGDLYMDDLASFTGDFLLELPSFVSEFISFEKFVDNTILIDPNFFEPKNFLKEWGNWNAGDLPELDIDKINQLAQAWQGVGQGWDISLLGGDYNFNSGSLPDLDFDFDCCNNPDLDIDFDIGDLPSLSVNFPTLNIDMTSLDNLLQAASVTGELAAEEILFNPGGLPFIDLDNVTDKFLDLYSTVQSPFLNLMDDQLQMVYVSPSQSDDATIVSYWETLSEQIANSTNLYPRESDPDLIQAQLASDHTYEMITGYIAVYGQMAQTGIAMAQGDVKGITGIIGQMLELWIELNEVIMWAGFSEPGEGGSGVAYESAAGDYAEWLKRHNPSEKLFPGDIVGVKGGEVSKEFDNAQKFLVISTAPIVLGKMPKTRVDEQYSEKVAFMGQVPVKVFGDVAVGDYILPSGSNDGIGIAVSPGDMKPLDYQRIVGVAWEANDDLGGVNYINTAVGINQNDMAATIDDMQMTLNAMQSSLAKLDSDFVPSMYETSSERNIRPSRNGVSVGAYHETKVSSCIEKHGLADASFESTKEQCEAANRVLLDLGIDVSKIPVLEALLLHPEHSEYLASYFQEGSNALREVLTTNK